MNYSLDALKKMWMAKTNEHCTFISAVNKENVDEFRNMLYDLVKQIHSQRFPYNNFLY